MKFFRQFIICILCMTVMAASGLVSAAEPEDCKCSERAGDNLRVLRQNMISQECSGYLPGQINELARGHMESMGEDGSWSDIDYDTAPSATFPAIEHVERVKRLACAYSIPNQPLFESKEVLEAIERSLPVIESKILKNGGGVRQTPGNWWYWNLSMPAKIGFILFCTEGKIDAHVFDESLISLRWCLEHPQNWYMQGLSGAAANSIWAIKGNLYCAVLEKNEEHVMEIVAKFKDNFRATNRGEEGLTEDDGNRAHVMEDFYGYYPSFVRDCVTILKYLDDSVYMPSDEELSYFANSLCEGSSWATYQGYRDMGLSGRTMNGPFTKAQTEHITIGLEFFANREGRFRERAQELLNLQKSGKEMHTGHKMFYSGDVAIHKTQDSYVSLRMGSSRNRVAESFSGNGMMSLFQGEGSMWILNDPEPLYNSSALACLDWFRLAGTTVVKDQMPYRFRSYFDSSEPFVGGVSDGEGGVSAMNVSQISYALNAQKSWFFFDDEVVCVGSGIESDLTSETHTIIDQRVNSGGKMLVDGKSLSGGVSLEQSLSDVSWIANDNVGYYFPEGTQVELKNEQRSGSWKRLSETLSADPLSANFTQLYLNHGSKPSDGSYAYAVLPNQSADAVKQYAQGDNITVLENSKTVHAVHDASTDSTGIVFWPENRSHLSATLSMNDPFYDGIYPRNIQSTVLRTIGVKVKDKIGVAAANATLGAQYFTVAEQRLTGDVEIEVNWFDDAEAESGAYWSVSYLSSTGVRNSEIVPYQYTDEWVTTKLLLPDAAFSGNGLKEDGVELAILYDKAVVDTKKEKYEVDMDGSMGSMVHDGPLYGPIVHEIRLHPVGAEKSTVYSQTAGIVTAEEPCIVYYKKIEDGIELSVSEPQQKGIPVNLLLDGRYELTDVKIINEPKESEEKILCSEEEGKTRLRVETKNGRTYKLTLKKKG